VIPLSFSSFSNRGSSRRDDELDIVVLVMLVIYCVDIMKVE
jgi:hypothetical protein